METRYAEPARRAFADAEALWLDGRLGTADHLFGLAAECALKAILCGLGLITADPPPAPFKVHINKLWGEYLTSLQGPAAPAIPRSSPFSDWNVNDRYEDDAFFRPERVAPHRDGARETLLAFEEAVTQGVVR